MGQKGSRLISYKQYRTTDLFIFVGLMVLAELTAHFGTIWFSDGALFSFSFMVPLTLIVMMRWGWQAVFCPIISALMYCFFNEGGARDYLVYIIGDMCIMAMLLPMYKFGKQKIAGKWYFSLLFTIGGWLCVYLGRAIVWTISYCVTPVEGAAIYSGFVNYGAWDLLSLAMGIIIILIMRRLDGIFEDQMTYLKRIDKERRDRLKADEFGCDPVEIDEETLSILNKDNDLY